MTNTINGLQRKIQTLHFVRIVLEICNLETGESALKSRILSKRHKKRTPPLSNIASLLTPHHDKSAQKGKDSNEPVLKQTTSNEPAKKKQPSVDQLFAKSATISAEIRWVLNLVTLKYWMNSSSNSENWFFVMFLDSDIVKWFQCRRTKAGYVAHFSLAPYFHELMLSKLSDCPNFSLTFDKSSNSFVRKGQLDILETNCVATCYLGSESMGRSIAEDVLQTFLAGISDLDQSKILQVASVSPNVNLLFLRLWLSHERKKSCYHKGNIQSFLSWMIKTSNYFQVLIQQMTELTHFLQKQWGCQMNMDIFWQFIKMFLILFHGQSEVERGFSVNKQLLVENVKTKSLVALGRI